MNLQKAIEILTLDKTCDYEGGAKDIEDAIQLGIEALKRLQWYRKWHRIDADTPLLGETKG